MAHLTINLQDGRLADVWYGKVSRKLSFFNFFSRSKVEKETKTGYVVRIKNAEMPREEYRLYESNDGKWSKDPEGQKELDHDMYLSIKNAIQLNSPS